MCPTGSSSSPRVSSRLRAWLGISGGVLLIVMIVVGLRWLLSPTLDENHNGSVDPVAMIDSATRLSNLLTTVRHGDPPDPAELRSLAAQHWQDILPHLHGWLNDDQAEVRVLAVRWIALRNDHRYLPAVMVRASDSDWRVRAAAFDAIEHLSTIAIDSPQRDTPLAQREMALLTWLKRRDTQAAADPSQLVLTDELCEIYAGARQIEFARPLAEACIRCHVGGASVDEQEPGSASCAACHEQIHRQWNSSAHANSVSHLRMMTVDPQTRQVQPLDLSPHRGLACMACHELADEPVEYPPNSNPTTDPGLKSAQCAHKFRVVSDPTGRCVTCHDVTHRQWIQWSRSPRPTLAAWPPGQIQMMPDATAVTCIDCHMPVNEVTGLRSHDWNVRRDVEVLASGIHVRVGPLARHDVDGASDNDGEGRWYVPVILTNLSGHAFPAGTRRRAVRVYVQFDVGGEVLRERRITDLIPDRSGGFDLTGQPALSAGEVRTLKIDCPTLARSITMRMTYVRHRLLEPDKEMEFIHMTQPLR